MKKTVVQTICNLCQKEVAIVYSERILVDKQADASGNGYECDYREIDLCGLCLSILVKKQRIKIIDQSWKGGTKFVNLPGYGTMTLSHIPQ